MKKKNLLMTAIATFGLATVTIAQVPSYVPTSGLVGWWPFNGNANDESGNGNNGKVNGATLTADRFGNVKNAYLFEVDGNAGWGSPQQSIIISNPNIPKINGFTMSSWVNLSDKPSPYKTRPHSIMARWDREEIFRFQVNNNSDYYSGETFDKSSLPAIISCPLINFNEWHHHLISYDGSTFRQYTDGILINEYVINIQILYGNSDLTFGETHMVNGHWLFFNGIMDDLGYWSRALTQKEITDLYNANTVSINENIQSKLFSVFPNPAQGLINIKADSKLIGDVYSIYDNTGRVVLTGKINSENTTIELGNLSGGIYIFNVEEKIKQTFTLIKE